MNRTKVCVAEIFKFSSHSLLSFYILVWLPPPPVSLSFCVGILSLTGMWADMGSYSDFHIHSASNSGANISHVVVVLPMSPLPWKRCIRGSGKAGCPLLIGRKGGRSFFLSSCLPRVFLLHRVFSLHLTLVPTLCVKTLELQLSPLATC